jgi:hypothetical protein
MDLCSISLNQSHHFSLLNIYDYLTLKKILHVEELPVNILQINNFFLFKLIFDKLIEF